MHTFSEAGPGVPAFLAKLWRLVEDPQTDNLISWGPDGKSFVIQNQAQFARELLPLNYKHNNMASFIRQLNMYGFHKIASIDNGGLKFDRDEMEFSHSYFQRNHPYLLEHIKRKIAHPKQTDEKSQIKPETVNKVLTEVSSKVKAMRGRQDTLDTRFTAIKQENEALWREIAVLRQKHMKQQQIVNKLIQFLVTIVQPQRSGLSGMGGKRRFQLMINDTPQSSNKMRRTNDENRGPIIHELSEELLDDVEEQNEFNYELSPPLSVEEMTTTEMPASPTKSHGGYSNQSDEMIIDGLQYPNYYIATISPDDNSGSGNNSGDGDFDNSGGADEQTQKDNTTAQNNLHFIENLNDELNVFDEANVLTTPMARRENEKAKLAQEKLNQQAANGNRRNVRSQRSGAKGRKDSNGNTSNRKIINKQQEPTHVVQESEGITFENVNIKMEKVPMYANQEDFMNTEMPSHIFDDENSSPANIDSSPMIGGINFDTNPHPQASSIGIQQQQQPTPGSSNVDNTIVEATGSSIQNNKNDWALQTTTGAGKHEDIYNLSTPIIRYRQDFDQHLDTFQGELDTLKDMLRGDGIAVDTGALLGDERSGGKSAKFYQPALVDLDQYLKLFSDSDVLEPFGIHMNEKKFDDTYNSYGASQLMTYQPSIQCDLSELLDEDTTPNETAIATGTSDDLD